MRDTAIVVGVGASRGVGAATCRRFAAEGLHVLVGGRTPAKIEAVAEEIRTAGGEATPVTLDATRSQDVQRLFDAAPSTPRLVVYNAGNNQFRSLLDMDDAFFEEVWRLCCFGGFVTGREAARRMLSDDSGDAAATGAGTLIFTGATASLRARPPFTAFASGKAALRAVAHGMAREFGPRGLHVAHVIIDGVIDGEMVNGRFPQFKQERGEDGMLSPEAIADAYWMLHCQDRRAWTLELDLRPYKESF